VNRYQKGKTNLDFTEETVSGGGISWAMCKSAPRSREITTPAPHHSVFCTGRMPFLPPNQQRQSTEGQLHAHQRYLIVLRHPATHGDEEVRVLCAVRRKEQHYIIVSGDSGTRARQAARRRYIPLRQSNSAAAAAAAYDVIPSYFSSFMIIPPPFFVR